MEADFAKNLELLEREGLDEAEFRKANEARREEWVRLTGRQTEISDWLAAQHGRQETVGSLPTRVRSSSRTSGLSIRAGPKRCCKPS